MTEFMEGFVIPFDSDMKSKDQNFGVSTTSSLVHLNLPFQGFVRRIRVSLISTSGVKAESITVKFNGFIFKTVGPFREQDAEYFKNGVVDDNTYFTFPLIEESLLSQNYAVHLVEDEYKEGKMCSVINMTKIDQVEVVVDLEPHSETVKVECRAFDLIGN